MLKNVIQTVNIMLFFSMLISASVIWGREKKNGLSAFSIFYRPLIIIFLLIFSGLLIFYTTIENRNILLQNLVLQTIQFSLFTVCLGAGYICSIRAGLPTFLFLRYGKKAKSILQKRFKTSFSAIYLVSEFIIILTISLIIWGIFRPVPSKEFSSDIMLKGYAKYGMICFVLSAAFMEEIIYRFYLQSAFLRLFKNRILSIIIASGIWALAHYGMAEPEGAKELQIFCVGIILGLVRNKWGIEPAIALHLMMNASFALLSLFQL